MKFLGNYLIALLLLASCGGTDTITPPEQKYTEALYDKGPDQILSLKYEKMNITCSVTYYKTTWNGETSSGKLPGLNVSFNLPSDLNSKKILSLKLGNLKGKLTFSLKNFKINEELDYIYQEKHRYILKFTPLFNVVLNTDLKQSDRSLSLDREEKLFTLIENVGSFHHSSRIPHELGEYFVQDVSCELKTIIKPGYQHQFQKVD